MRLDLNLIEVFCCVYEEQSFSRAAQRLRLSQPTVSGHIKNLETYIGARLFDRQPRLITPTRAGEILYRHGRIILDEKEAATRALHKLLNKIEGSLTIAASTIPGEFLLPVVIASFHARFPSVKVEIRISDSVKVCEEVLSGKAEIGFTGAKPDALGLEVKPFASDDLALVAPNDNEWRDVKALSIDALAQKPFIAREPGSGTRLAFEKRIGRSLDQFNVVGCFGSTNAVKEALRAGLGVSVLSLLSVNRDIQAGCLKAVEIEGVGVIRREFFSVLNKKLAPSPVVEAFVEFALNPATDGEAAVV